VVLGVLWGYCGGTVGYLVVLGSTWGKGSTCRLCRVLEGTLCYCVYWVVLGCTVGTGGTAGYWVILGGTKGH